MLLLTDQWHYRLLGFLGHTGHYYYYANAPYLFLFPYNELFYFLHLKRVAQNVFIY